MNPSHIHTLMPDWSDDSPDVILGFRAFVVQSVCPLYRGRLPIVFEVSHPMTLNVFGNSL